MKYKLLELKFKRSVAIVHWNSRVHDSFVGLITAAIFYISIFTTRNSFRHFLDGLELSH